MNRWFDFLRLYPSNMSQRATASTTTGTVTSEAEVVAPSPSPSRSSGAQTKNPFKWLSFQYAKLNKLKYRTRLQIEFMVIYESTAVLHFVLGIFGWIAIGMSGAEGYGMGGTCDDSVKDWPGLLTWAFILLLANIVICLVLFLVSIPLSFKSVELSLKVTWWVFTFINLASAFLGFVSLILLTPQNFKYSNGCDMLKYYTFGQVLLSTITFVCWLYIYAFRENTQ